MSWTAKMCHHRLLYVVVFDVVMMVIKTNEKQIFVSPTYCKWQHLHSGFTSSSGAYLMNTALVQTLSVSVVH